MPRPQQVRDVVEGGRRQQRQRLGVDGEHVTPVELGDAHIIGAELAVRRRVRTVREHFLEMEFGHRLKRWLGYFFRKLSSLTILEAASSGLASAAAAAASAAAGSDLAFGSGAGSGVGVPAPASDFSSRLPALSLRSNCRPKRTDGSTKADSAMNGTLMCSCCLLKLTDTSKKSSWITRSQYWCCSTMVISSGYLARR